eukprot:UN28212
MGCRRPGTEGATCAQIGASLSILISQVNDGPFKNQFCSFHNTPKIVTVKETKLSKIMAEVKKIYRQLDVNIL